MYTYIHTYIYIYIYIYLYICRVTPRVNPRVGALMYRYICITIDLSVSLSDWRAGGRTIHLSIYRFFYLSLDRSVNVHIYIDRFIYTFILNIRHPLHIRTRVMSARSRCSGACRTWSSTWRRPRLSISLSIYRFKYR